ncbi:MAG: DegV family protein [Lachnoclostridium sp.]|jgi:DegV family protein with EDD domain
MGMIKILADSTCDLSEELLKKYDITLIPLCVTMGDMTYQDGVNITPEDIYEWSEKENSTPKTAAPVLNDVIDILKPYTDQNMEIIFFGISEEMSSTCNVLRLAADFLEYDKIHIINSKNLSTGIGLQILKAATMAKEGINAGEIVEYITNSMQERVKASFVVDTLTYLHRGGRCSSVAALIGNAFHLKPMIIVKNGKMGVGKKYRGSTKKVLLNYVNDLKPELLEADNERVFLTHSGCDKEIVNMLYEFLKELNIFREILVTRAGSVISSHCGPQTLGVLYVSKH